MYQTVYIPVDNSILSNRAIDLGIEIASAFNSKCIGSHVYAAALHDLRFKQMESGLPPKYLQEKILEEQRDVHNDLISRGLHVISDSYLRVFADKCSQKAIPFEAVNLEGRNFEELVKDINRNRYDLIIIGATGQGKVKPAQIGSVCERILRRIKQDTLVVKNEDSLRGKKIIVGMDGSSEAYGGMLTAIELARKFDMEIELAAVFDPFFHYHVFKSISTVLSEEETNIFNFKEQEQLHEEIIDSGLEKIYRQFLNIAQKIASDHGMNVTTSIIPGKTFEKLLEKAESERPALMVLGRIGIHSGPDMDIGNTTENMLRLANCNILVSSRRFDLQIEQKVEEMIEWTDEAKDKLRKIPVFAQGIAKKTIEEHALSSGHTVITTTLMESVLEKVLPPSMKSKMRGDGAPAD